jgi:hypothetical protein
MPPPNEADPNELFETYRRALAEHERAKGELEGSQERLARTKTDLDSAKAALLEAVPDLDPDARSRARNRERRNG